MDDRTLKNVALMLGEQGPFLLYFLSDRTWPGSPTVQSLLQFASFAMAVIGVALLERLANRQQAEIAKLRQMGDRGNA